MGFSIAGYRQVLALVPTQLECDQLEPSFVSESGLRVCGFGPIESGIETARLLGEGSFDHVLLLGIAGSYDLERLALGSAYCFEQVQMEGIGVGQSDSFRSAADLGFAATDTLPLVVTGDGGQTGGTLLTVTAAAGDDHHAASRRSRYPQATAEDMEAWSVTLAAKRFGCDTTVVRGISNLVGNRDHRTWQIQTAMQAAARLCESLRT